MTESSRCFLSFMKTVGLVSLGCARNLVDSEVMLGCFKKAGYHIAHDPVLCDVIVVNTCGFIGDAKKESIDAILEMAVLKKKGSLKKLVVAGCLSQRYASALAKEIPEVDLFIGTGDFPKVVKLLEKMSFPRSLSLHDLSRERESSLLQKSLDPRFHGDDRVHVGRPEALTDEDSPRLLSTPKAYAYVKLAEGCRHSCSFCVIPQLRGKLRSRPVGSILREVAQLKEQGVREFNLIAQDSTDYGKDLKDGTSLMTLFDALNRIPGEQWFRLFYAYPHGFPLEVLEFFKNGDNIVPYLDIPTQHINDRILKSMRRGGTGREIRELIANIRKRVPQITLRTTLIVGYPGETDKEFQELSDWIAEGPFDHVGVFTYSHEEGTTAGKLKDDVPTKVKRDRRKKIMELQKTIVQKRNQQWIGKTVKVLVEKEGIARHAGQGPEVDGIIHLEQKLPMGDFAWAQITAVKEYDLVVDSQKAVAT